MNSRPTAGDGDKARHASNSNGKRPYQSLVSEEQLRRLGKPRTRIPVLNCDNLPRNSKDCDLFFPSPEDYSTLHFNVRNVNRLQSMLASGCDARAKNKRGQTPLHVSVLFRFDEASEILLSATTWSDDQDEDGNTPLHVAAEVQSVSLVTKLLASGFSSDVQNRKGQTPLHIALLEGEDVAEVLIRAGCRNDRQDEDGNSPLHIAAERGLFVTMRKLVDSGLDARLQNRKGQTPLHLALRRSDSQPPFKWIDGCENSLQDEDGKTPLHLALEGRCGNIAQKLLFLGMHPHVKDKQGKYPLQSALVQGIKDSIHAVLSMLALRGVPVDWRTPNLEPHKMWPYIVFHQGCIAENERMKDTLIHVDAATYHDVARQSISRVAGYLENEHIRKVLQYDDALEDFPIYAKLIAFKVMMAEKRRSLTVQSRKSFAVLFRKLPSLPRLVIDKILSNLCERDLRSFSEASRLTTSEMEQSV